MGIKLSHSAATKYKTCPQQYKLHYLDRIRPDKLGSALLFGSALDEALNVLLETKLDNPPENATDDLDRLKQGFDHHMTYQIFNKEQEDVRTSHFIEYFGSDFERDILTDPEFKSLRMFIKNAGYEEEDPLALYDEISKNIKAKRDIAPTDQIYYNYCSWLSLKRKGHLMLEHYKETIMPLIKRVVSVQREVNLPNESGDLIRGFIDFEAELWDYEELGVITIDNKTSGKNYKLADINEKGQLLIYDEETQNGHGAYIVLIKKIAYHKALTCQDCGSVTSRAVKSCPEGGTGKNRCGGALDLEKTPYIKHQILVDSIDEEKKDLLFEEFCGILSSIENKEFPQIREDNNCFQFGRKCPYYDYCRSSPADPDYTGLVRG